MAIAYLDAKPKDYSSVIVNVLIQAQEAAQAVPSLAVAGPARNLEERIKTMLRPGRQFYRRPSSLTAILVLLTAMLTVPTTLVLVARGNPQPIAGDMKEPYAFPRPLAEFPLTLNGWTGMDMEIPSAVQQYLQANVADDSINRRYTNVGGGQWADLYVTYSSSFPPGVLQVLIRESVSLPTAGYGIGPSRSASSPPPIACWIVSCTWFHNPPIRADVVVMCFCYSGRQDHERAGPAGAIGPRDEACKARPGM